ncbi:unnamed protein product [Rotaria magnacalcarata]|uniref:Uncharacterized protein n=1 Tax=Rotaria magnacalcarata TaxID=392030 RepID=A0A8S2LT29_9BILA|nr:unnamed protein product [Rotaria magnacalcarata]
MSSFNINTAEQLSTTKPYNHLANHSFQEMVGKGLFSIDWLEEMVGEGLFRLTAANGLKTSANVSTKISINSLIFSSAKDSTTVGFYPTNRSIAVKNVKEFVE